MPDWQKSYIERRLFDRRRTFKGANVLFNDNAVVAECTVRDLSDTGAKLTFKSMYPLPKRFRVMINEIGVFDCEIMRISGLDFGVKFLGVTEISPSGMQQAAHNVSASASD
jgi:hypothetical protein